jgi:hypothetical protein
MSSIEEMSFETVKANSTTSDPLNILLLPESWSCAAGRSATTVLFCGFVFSPEQENNKTPRNELHQFHDAKITRTFPKEKVRLWGGLYFNTI